MSFVRSVFLENWRNKSVALFFAVSIWFVAYQSDERQLYATYNVRLQALNSESFVIVSSRTENEEKLPVNFNGRVEVTFSGPRKQIELLRVRPRPDIPLSIAHDGDEKYRFQSKDFGFPRDGVSIVKIDPPWVEVHQEEVVEIVKDLKDAVDILPPRPGYRVFTTFRRPESGSVRLRTPQSLKEKVHLRIPVDVASGENVKEGRFELQVSSTDRDLLQRTVKLLDFERDLWVSPLEAPRVYARIRLLAREESFQLDAVKITFRLPPLPYPHRVVLREAPGDTIPVKFTGPRDSIERLKTRFEEQPGLALSVPPPPSPIEPGIFTFVEDALEIPAVPGVTDVRVAPHEDREKGPWSFEIKVYPPKTSDDAGSPR